MVENERTWNRWEYSFAVWSKCSPPMYISSFNILFIFSICVTISLFCQVPCTIVQTCCCQLWQASHWIHKSIWHISRKSTVHCMAWSKQKSHYYSHHEYFVQYAVDVPLKRVLKSAALRNVAYMKKLPDYLQWRKFLCFSTNFLIY